MPMNYCTDILDPCGLCYALWAPMPSLAPISRASEQGRPPFKRDDPGTSNRRR